MGLVEVEVAIRYLILFVEKCGSVVGGDEVEHGGEGVD